MKILLANYHGLDSGGSQQSTQTLADGLAGKGHDVSIASTQNYESGTVHFEPFLPLTFFQNSKLKNFFACQIKANGFEIIHAQDRLTSFAAVLAAKQEGIPCIVHFRDYWFDCTKSNIIIDWALSYIDLTKKCF